LGKKPLHYALHRGRLFFGSEIKAILTVAPELAEVDSEGLLQYFYFGYIPDPLTAFQSIKKLPPGHLLEYASGKIDIRQYWDVPEYGTHPAMSEEECLEELERRLQEAVRIRLISEVPLGAMLSGGVDSSIVVALMARESSSPVKTFSIGFQAEKFNEAKYARLVAERFGTDHHELVLDPNLEETLTFLSGMLEEPFGDSSMLPTYYVSRMAREHVTVALSGDGGDELFAGYDRYLTALQRRRFDLTPRWLGRFYREQVHDRLPSEVYGKNLAWNASLDSCERYLDSVSFFPALHRERDLFSAEFLESARRLPDPLAQWRRHYDAAPARDLLSRLMYLDVKTYLAADILTKVDRMSMATSLEVRVPMLDHEFVEWVVSLPVDWKFQAGTRKYILKKLAQRLGIPRELLDRPKQGFQVPLVEWMRSEMKDQYLRVLLEPRTLQRGYFKPEAVRSLIDEHTNGRRNRSGLLWRMLVLELWHRNFLESKANWGTQYRIQLSPSGTGVRPKSDTREVEIPPGIVVEQDLRCPESLQSAASAHRNEDLRLKSRVNLGSRRDVPIRVAFVGPSLRYVGGQSVQADLLMQNWRDDPEVTAKFVPIDPSFPLFLKWAERVPGLRTLLREPIYALSLWRELKDVDLAHIYSASYWSFLLAPLPAWLTARMRGKKTLINYHSGEARDHLKRSRVAPRVLRKADRVVVPSGYLVDVFREFGLEAQAIANVVDLSQFRYRPRQPLRPHLVCTRGFHPYYGIDVVVRAFADVQKAHPEARLDLVGGGALEGEIRELVSQLNIPNVNFVGVVPRSEIGKHYDRADIFVNGSNLDNMPVSVLEAFAAGTPVVTTEPGCMKYFISHERTGLLSPPGNSVILAQNILRVLSDADLAAQLAENAVCELKRYQWAAVREQWLEVYQNLVPQPVTAESTVPAMARVDGGNWTV
jgi:asparagine synthase (glutamine-hydrolysing)